MYLIIDEYSPSTWPPRKTFLHLTCGSESFDGLPTQVILTRHFLINVFCIATDYN